MKLRFAALYLTLVCVAFSTSAFATVIFNDGAIDGHDGAFFIPGPSFGPQDISNGFTASASATPTTLQFGLWIGTGIVPTTVSYEIGTSAFGTDLGSATVALNGSNSTFLFNNGLGFDVYSVTIPVTSLAMIAGDTYWLSLSNASDSQNSGTEAWDIPNGGFGGPAICNDRFNGINLGNCPTATGESWVLSSTTIPEPGSLILFGSGLIGLVGVVRCRFSL